MSEGGLGVLALRQRPPHVVYAHTRNPLRDVWERPQHATEFAPLVWYYLNQPKVGADGTVVADLRDRWQAGTDLAQRGRETSTAPAP